MKKFCFFVPFIVVLIIIPFFACKSAPAAGEPAPPPKAEPAPAGPNQALLNELDAAIAKANDARKRALDFESPDYFPSEWEAAEDKLAQAGQVPKDTDSHIRDAITAYNTAAEAYDSVFMMTIPLYAQAREDEIMAVRDKLIAAGARDTFPEPFPAADETALTALNQYEAKDYYAARDSAAKALAMFQSMSAGYDAWLVRCEIIDRGFEVFDPDNFNSADEIILGGVDDYWAENYPVAQEKAEEALQRYKLVLSTGWVAYAEQCYAKSDAGRKAALDAKADVAVKDMFTEGDSHYNPAVKAFDSKNYQEAAELFVTAEALFNESRIIAEKKRREAEITIDKADKKIVESDETVRKAEVILEGGEK